jgi:hypothetical protein
MRTIPLLVLSVSAVLAAGAPAWGFRDPDANAPVLTEHQKELRYADSQSQPYAMTYADEAARKLGVRDGQWEAFNSRSSDPVMLKGGLNGGRPMLTLEWRPGQ